MPPPIRAAELWLTAYAAGDEAQLMAVTVPDDRDPLQRALRAPNTSRIALALPPRPVEHRIIEVADRGQGWQILALELTVANPLPSASRKIGAPMRGIPETRSVRHRLRLEEVSGAWGVRLDLAQVLLRARFSEELLLLIADGYLAEARRRLAASLPAPPQDGHRTEGSVRPDRMVEELERRLREAETRVRTATTTAEP